MKKLAIVSLMGLGAMALQAETLNIVSGGVTYAYPSAQVGEMDFSGANALTVMGKTFAIGEISEMYVDNSTVEPYTVTIKYSGETATVVVDGTIAGELTCTVSGAHVSFTQADGATDEITYILSGSSTNGSFLTAGSLKASVELCGLTLTNPYGAPVNIQNGKRNKLTIKEDNTLVDSKNGTQKGCLNCKGHLEIKGHGSLTLTGNTADALHASEYITLKNATINVLSAAKDGIKCNQYMTMESGTLNIKGTQDDGLQVSYKDETNRDAEDTGILSIIDGTISIETSGSSSEGITADNEIHISGGTISVKSADDAINSKSHTYISGGTITAISTGNDGIDTNGSLYISGGNIIALGAGGAECGIDANEEERYTVYFTGGNLLALGGRNSTPTTTDSTQAYVSGTLSVSAGQTVELKSGTTVLASFVIPANYTGSSSSSGGWGGGPGGWGGGPGGGSGSSMLVTCPGIKSGSSYTLTNGSSTVSATARQTGSSGGWH